MYLSKLASQPLKETSLLTDSLEPTNQWYAITKISGIKACEAIRKQYGSDYLSLMPCNLFGYYDNFDLSSSHVLPAMISKFHEAKNIRCYFVGIWKSVKRISVVDDLADAVLFSLENHLADSLYNVGSGKEISIKSLAQLIQNIVGHKGKVLWDL